MSEIRQENIQNVKGILTTKGIYKDYHKQNFQNYDYGEMSPINNDILNIMPNGTIILGEEVYQSLLAVQELTLTEGQEIPFWLYGKEIGNNQIVFDQFFSQSKNRFNAKAFYGNQMINDLTLKISNNNTNNFVVCRGHSHPQIGSYYENFSLGDLAGDIQFNQDNQVFRSKKIETVSCVVTLSGNINFLYYDNINQNFYRFNKVLVKNKDNTYTYVNCYDNKQQNTMKI